MKKSVSFFSLLIASLGCHGKATRFLVKDAAQRDTVLFVSETPLEKTVGLSSAIAGWIELDPENIPEGIKGEFEVDLRTFDTGNPLRNEQMRERFLNTSEFPVATYSISRLLGSPKNKLMEQQPVVARVEGVFKIKGVPKPQNASLKMTYFKQSETTRQRLSGNLLRISSQFNIDILAFNIAIHDLLRGRLAKFLQVSVDVVGTDTLPAALVGEPPKVKERNESKAAP